MDPNKRKELEKQLLLLKKEFVKKQKKLERQSRRILAKQHVLQRIQEHSLTPDEENQPLAKNKNRIVSFAPDSYVQVPSTGSQNRTDPSKINILNTICSSDDANSDYGVCHVSTVTDHSSLVSCLKANQRQRENIESSGIECQSPPTCESLLDADSQPLFDDSLQADQSQSYDSRIYNTSNSTSSSFSLVLEQCNNSICPNTNVSSGQESTGLNQDAIIAADSSEFDSPVVISPTCPTNPKVVIGEVPPKCTPPSSPRQHIICISEASQNDCHVSYKKDSTEITFANDIMPPTLLNNSEDMEQTFRKAVCFKQNDSLQKLSVKSTSSILDDCLIVSQGSQGDRDCSRTYSDAQNEDKKIVIKRQIGSATDIGFGDEKEHPHVGDDITVGSSDSVCDIITITDTCEEFSQEDPLRHNENHSYINPAFDSEESGSKAASALISYKVPGDSEEVTAHGFVDKTLPSSSCKHKRTRSSQSSVKRKRSRRSAAFSCMDFSFLDDESPDMYSQIKSRRQITSRELLSSQVTDVSTSQEVILPKWSDGLSQLNYIPPTPCDNKQFSVNKHIIKESFVFPTLPNVALSVDEFDLPLRDFEEYLQVNSNSEAYFSQPLAMEKQMQSYGKRASKGEFLLPVREFAYVQEECNQSTPSTCQPDLSRASTSCTSPSNSTPSALALQGYSELANSRGDFKEMKLMVQIPIRLLYRCAKLKALNVKKTINGKTLQTSAMIYTTKENSQENLLNKGLNNIDEKTSLSECQTALITTSEIGTAGNSSESCIKNSNTPGNCLEIRDNCSGVPDDSLGIPGDFSEVPVNSEIIPPTQISLIPGDFSEAPANSEIIPPTQISLRPVSQKQLQLKKRGKWKENASKRKFSGSSVNPIDIENISTSSDADVLSNSHGNVLFDDSYRHLVHDSKDCLIEKTEMKSKLLDDDHSRKEELKSNNNFETDCYSDVILVTEMSPRHTEESVPYKSPHANSNTANELDSVTLLGHTMTSVSEPFDVEAVTLNDHNELSLQSREEFISQENNSDSEISFNYRGRNSSMIQSKKEFADNDDVTLPFTGFCGNDTFVPEENGNPGEDFNDDSELINDLEINQPSKAVKGGIKYSNLNNSDPEIFFNFRTRCQFGDNIRMLSPCHEDIPDIIPDTEFDLCDGENSNSEPEISIIYDQIVPSAQPESVREQEDEIDLCDVSIDCKKGGGFRDDKIITGADQSQMKNTSILNHSLAGLLLTGDIDEHECDGRSCKHCCDEYEELCICSDHQMVCHQQFQVPNAVVQVELCRIALIGSKSDYIVCRTMEEILLYRISDQDSNIVHTWYLAKIGEVYGMIKVSCPNAVCLALLGRFNGLALKILVHDGSDAWSFNCDLTTNVSPSDIPSLGVSLEDREVCIASSSRLISKVTVSAGLRGIQSRSRMVCDERVLGLVRVEGCSQALIGLSQQHLYLWNHVTGSLLFFTRLPLVCLPRSSTAVEQKGLLYLPIVTTSAVAIIVINPLSALCIVLENLIDDPLQTNVKLYGNCLLTIDSSLTFKVWRLGQSNVLAQKSKVTCFTVNRQSLVLASDDRVCVFES